MRFKKFKLKVSHELGKGASVSTDDLLDVSDITDQVVLDTDQMVHLFSSDRVHLKRQNPE